MMNKVIALMTAVLLITCLVSPLSAYAEIKLNITSKQTTAQDTEDLFVIQGENGYGYCNSAGITVIPCVWASASNFENGVAIVQKRIDGDYGCINTKGQLIIPCEYDQAYIINGYPVMIKNREDHANYVFNSKGDRICPFIINNANPPYIEEDGIVYRGKDYRTHFYSFKTKKDKVIANSSDYGASEGLVVTSYGYVDHSGKTVISMDFDRYMCDPFHEGLAKVYDRRSKQSGFIDKNGHFVIPCILSADLVDDFSEGLAVAAVKKENWGWGFIDKNGNTVIPFQYEQAYDFQNGLAAVKNDNQLWGFIDKKGNQIVDFIYEKVGYYHNGYCLVTRNDKSYYIDKNGNFAFSYFEGKQIDVEALVKAEEFERTKESAMTNMPLIDEFTLHSGTTFGMSLSEVKAKEEAKGFSPSETKLAYMLYDNNGEYTAKQTDGLVMFGSVAGISDSRVNYYHIGSQKKLFDMVYVFGDHSTDAYTDIQQLLENKYSQQWVRNDGTAPSNLVYFFNNMTNGAVKSYEKYYIQYNDTYRIYITHGLYYNNLPRYTEDYNLFFSGEHYLEYRIVSKYELESIQEAMRKKHEQELTERQQRENEIQQERNNDI